MLKVSKHCQERYAERIMGRDEKLSINTYIAQNEDKISERVNKMYEYGTKIYEGKTKEDGNFVHIFFSNPWVLLTDRKEEIAITLYKIEAVKEETEQDAELNSLFIRTRIDKLNALDNEITELKNENESEVKKFRDEMDENKSKIREYEDLIVALRKRNEGLQDVINYGDARLLEAESRYRDLIEELVGVKILKR
jgi:hypothetical protein